MEIGDLIVTAILSLIFGIVLFTTNYLFPVSTMILGLGLFNGKNTLKGIFSGFFLSFFLFRIVISLIVKLGEFSPTTIHYTAIFFLLLFAIMLLFPKFSIWNHAENNFKSGFFYSSYLGFVWSFWVGLSKFVFADYYEPKWIGFLEIYLTAFSTLSPALIITLAAFVLSKIYPIKYTRIIEIILAVLTIIVAASLTLNIVTILPRDGLKPENPPPVPLHELFYPNS